jgi:hypothetical protein
VQLPLRQAGPGAARPTRPPAVARIAFHGVAVSPDLAQSPYKCAGVQAVSVTARLPAESGGFGPGVGWKVVDANDPLVLGARIPQVGAVGAKGPHAFGPDGEHSLAIWSSGEQAMVESRQSRKSHVWRFRRNQTGGGHSWQTECSVQRPLAGYLTTADHWDSTAQGSGASGRIEVPVLRAAMKGRV